MNGTNLTPRKHIQTRIHNLSENLASSLSECISLVDSVRDDTVFSLGLRQREIKTFFMSVFDVTAHHVSTVTNTDHEILNFKTLVLKS